MGNMSKKPEAKEPLLPVGECGMKGEKTKTSASTAT